MSRKATSSSGNDCIAAASTTSGDAHERDRHARRERRAGVRAGVRGAASGTAKIAVPRVTAAAASPEKRLVARDLGGEHRAERERRAEREAAEHLADREHADRAALDAREIGGGERQWRRRSVSHRPRSRVSGGVAQDAEARDLDLDRVAGDERPDARGVPVRMTSPGSSVKAADA